MFKKTLKKSIWQTISLSISQCFSLSCQVKYIYIALFTILIASKQLHSINQKLFLEEKHPRLVELIKGITDWLINLNIPN